MKNSVRGLSAVVLLYIVALVGINTSNAGTISESLNVTRFTLIDTSSALVETGHLLDNGQFKVVSSQTVTLAFWEYPQLQPISGKVVVTLSDFLLVQAKGWISNWVRSDKVYVIDFTTQLVIVCIKGVCDPNAGPDTSLPNLTLLNFIPYPIPVVVNWDNQQGNPIYDNQDVKVSWYVVNSGGSDVKTAFSTAVYIDDRFVGEARLNYLAVGSNNGLMFDAVNAGKWPAGTHTVKVVADWKNEVKEWKEDDNSYTLTFVVQQKVVPPVITTLQNNVPVANNFGVGNSIRIFKITVPIGQTLLQIMMVGGTGNCDLYVKSGAQPSLLIYDYRSNGDGTSETVTIVNPVAGDYYIVLYGVTAYSGVSLTASFQRVVDVPTITVNIDHSKPISQFGMSFPTVAGEQYIVEISDTMPASVWTAVQTIIGDGKLKTFLAEVKERLAGFFRIRREAVPLRFKFPLVGVYSESRINGGYKFGNHWEGKFCLDEPNKGNRLLHTGVDFQAAANDKVFAVENCVVKYAQIDATWGGYIVLEFAKSYTITYEHIVPSIAEGAMVTKGMEIGKIAHGNGNFKPHLHFQIRTKPYSGSDEELKIELVGRLPEKYSCVTEVGRTDVAFPNYFIDPLGVIWE